MLTEARYQAEAQAAETRRASAKSDDEARVFGEIAGAYATAGRHVRFHGEWSRRAASERQAARLGPLRVGGGYGPINPVQQAQGLAQAEQSAQIAANHKGMAEAYQEAAEELLPTLPAPPSPDQGLPQEPGTPDQSLPPVCNDTPYVDGAGTVGSTLTCTMGNWTGSPSSYAYQWKSDGTTDIGTGASYVVVGEDVGHSLTCVVTASNYLGSATAPPSNAVFVT
jgi:hypothetical protein